MYATKMLCDPYLGWRVLLREKGVLAIAIAVFFLFGANLERRTALKRVPQTDLGVFTTAVAAIASGGNVYAVTDWHGWHYVYPPVLAILFYPLAFANPTPQSIGTPRTPQNTPWGYSVDSGDDFYGLHKDNFAFFCIVAIWYSISVVLTVLSVHLLVCALEGSLWRHAPPADFEALQKWWRLRYVPVLVCLTSIGTEFSRGQVDVVMLFAVAAGLYMAAHRRGSVAGVFLSIPAVIKMLPPLILLLPFWNRQWRLVYGIALGLTLTALVIPAASLGLAGTVQAYRNWGDLLVKPGLIGGKDATLSLCKP